MPRRISLNRDLGFETAGPRAKAALAATAAKAERARGIAVAVDLAAIEAGALVLVGQQIIGVGYGAEPLARLGIILVAIGWSSLASFRYAFLMSASLAVRATPSVGIGTATFSSVLQFCSLCGFASKRKPQPRLVRKGSYAATSINGATSTGDLHLLRARTSTTPSIGAISP